MTRAIERLRMHARSVRTTFNKSPTRTGLENDDPYSESEGLMIDSVWHPPYQKPPLYIPTYYIETQDAFPFPHRLRSATWSCSRVLTYLIPRPEVSTESDGDM